MTSGKHHRQYGSAEAPRALNVDSEAMRYGAFAPSVENPLMKRDQGSSAIVLGLFDAVS